MNLEIFLKLHILSDIHLEYSKWTDAISINDIDADISILAGDIGEGLQGLEWAMTFNRPVIYVMGNHEFYGQQPMLELWQKARKIVENSNVYLLENQSIVIEGIRFLGTTLWTDFKVLGDAHFEESKRVAYEDIRDFRVIYMSWRDGASLEHESPTYRTANLLEPHHTIAMHMDSRGFLARELDKPAENSWKTTVVVTHHAPSVLSLEEKVGASPIDAAYVSNLDELINKSELWIHGHTHVPVDYRVGKGRVVSNPRGYIGIETVVGFNPDFVVEI